MNKRPKSSKRKSASVGIAICFVAAVVIVGTYTLRSYQKSEQQGIETTEENSNTEDETKQPSASANTDKLVIDTQEDEKEEQEEAVTEEENTAPSGENASEGEYSASTSSSSTALNFGENSELLWPVNGQILLNYSMDKTVYFSTLDQYKYNPALIISGAEGDQVISGAAGMVKSIDVTAQTGTTVNLDLGNGYELFVGQLKEVPVNTGDYVDANTVIGYVSQPTKYYSVEGCNVYYELRKDGQPVDPLEYVSE